MTGRTLVRNTPAGRGRRAALAVALAAALAAAATAAASVSPAAATARAPSRPAAGTGTASAAQTSPGTASAAQTTPRTASAAQSSPGTASAAGILLLNGDRALVSSTAGGHTTSIQRGPGLSGLAGEVTTFRTAANTFLFPTAALPYLGRGLDPSLFELTALRHAEHGGRLPVTLHYRGTPHAMPGITVTRRGVGTAQGYLTAASALKFGAALARQMLADHPHGRYGRDGLFAGGLSIALTGAPAAVPARPHRISFPMHTLTVRGTNLAGRTPATWCSSRTSPPPKSSATRSRP